MNKWCIPESWELFEWSSVRGGGGRAARTRGGGGCPSGPPEIGTRSSAVGGVFPGSHTAGAVCFSQAPRLSPAGCRACRQRFNCTPGRAAAEVSAGAVEQTGEAALKFGANIGSTALIDGLNAVGE